MSELIDNLIKQKDTNRIRKAVRNTARKSDYNTTANQDNKIISFAVRSSRGVQILRPHFIEEMDTDSTNEVKTFDMNMKNNIQQDLMVY
jgi:uncharacterized protein YpuA (DUF1002 family)